MPYTHVQFIAYEIDTTPEEDPDVEGKGTYLGLPAFDVEARCHLMLRAMETARDNLPQQPPPPEADSTLKVFVAPEFFFRGPEGAYSMTDVQRAISLLQGMVVTDQWKDWLFGFGTIVGVSAPTGADPLLVDPAADKEVYNFSLIQKGGVTSQGDAGARVVMKELKSGIDFVADSATPDSLLHGEVEHLDPAGASGPGREQQRVNYDGSGIFDVDGITWGLEICLDHDPDAHRYEGRLLMSPQLPGAAQVQVQLVISCGMSIEDGNVVAMPGGYVFNCDGLGPASSTLKCVATTMTNIGPLQPAQKVGEAPISIDEASPHMTAAVDQLYRTGAGQIVFYPAQPLPPASTVPGSVLELPPWQPWDDYQFNFKVTYDQTGKFKAVLVEPVSKKTWFHDNDYILPLSLQLHSSAAVSIGNPDPDVDILMEVIDVTGAFAHAVRCVIMIAGFHFMGEVFQFHDNVAGGPPATIW